jgi:hypothetical protein
MEKLKATNFSNVLVFHEISGFPANTVRPISFQRNDVDG